MGRQAAQIFAEALELEVDERAELASRMIASIDGAPDPDTDHAWATEIERRANRAISGESQGSDWEQVRSRIQAKLES